MKKLVILILTLFISFHSYADNESSLRVYVIKNNINNPVFTRDIDNKLTINIKKNAANDGEIYLYSCFLFDTSEDQAKQFEAYINTAKTEAEKITLQERYADYNVHSKYASHGIEDVSKIMANLTKGYIENLASSLGIEVKVDTNCYDLEKNKSVHYIIESNHFLNHDVFLIPYYYYKLIEEETSFLDGITKADVIGITSLDTLKTLSDQNLEYIAKKEKRERELQERYANLAEQKSKDFVGSLFLSVSEYRDRPKFCTLNYSDGDAFPLIGYRLMGDAMIPDSPFTTKTGTINLIDYYNEIEITLNFNRKYDYFENEFDDISEAFLNIKYELISRRDNQFNSIFDDYCNIFIDYPENLLKLKNALERDLEVQIVLGNLFDQSITNKLYAIGQGFDDYEQYSFAYQIDADYRDVKSLENYQIINLSEFNKVQDEIVSISYSNDTNLSNVLTYLSDLNGAQQQGMNVVEYRDVRVEEKERLAKIAREEAELKAEVLDDNFTVYLGYLLYYANYCDKSSVTKLAEYYSRYDISPAKFKKNKFAIIGFKGADKMGCNTTKAFLSNLGVL